jgi:hypothetical protein
MVGQNPFVIDEQLTIAERLHSIRRHGARRSAEQCDRHLHGPCLVSNPELADLLLSEVGELTPPELPEVELLRG